MYEPRIVAFFCNWCTYTASDLAGTARMTYAPNVPVIRVMCSGRVDPQFVLKAFEEGADGVLIGGCHPGDCHYQEGNYKALRRFRLLKRVLEQFGVEDDRVRLEWISASEGDRVQHVIDDMTERLRRLGPWARPHAVPGEVLSKSAEQGRRPSQAPWRLPDVASAKSGKPGVSVPRSECQGEGAAPSVGDDAVTVAQGAERCPTSRR